MASETNEHYVCATALSCDQSFKEDRGRMCAGQVERALRWQHCWGTELPGSNSPVWASVCASTQRMQVAVLFPWTGDACGDQGTSSWNSPVSWWNMGTATGASHHFTTGQGHHSESHLLNTCMMGHVEGQLTKSLTDLRIKPSLISYGLVILIFPETFR